VWVENEVEKEVEKEEVVDEFLMDEFVMPKKYNAHGSKCNDRCKFPGPDTVTRDRKGQGA
jgi:hypothetical protein